jgi:hypothetical protein
MHNGVCNAQEYRPYETKYKAATKSDDLLGFIGRFQPSCRLTPKLSGAAPHHCAR